MSADVFREEWNAYVDAHPQASVYHAWEWRQVYDAAFRHRTEYLAARRADGRIVGVLPLVVFDHWLLGRFMVSLPFVNYGGVLADSDEAAEALLAEASGRARWYGLSHVELRHTTARFEQLPRRTHKVAMTMPLPASAAAAWEALDRKVRNQVRKAEKSGLAVEHGGAALVPEFYAIFAENMRDLGTPVYPERWFSEILRHFPDRSRVWLVRHDGRAVAGAITLTHRSSVEVPSAGSLRAFRAMCPNMLLYWSIMTRAIEERLTVLDFGRSTPGEGTFRFKQQWGAVPGPLSWEYVLLSRRDLPDRSPRNRRFQHAIALWQRLPLTVTNAVGPRLVRFLP